MIFCILEKKKLEILINSTKNSMDNMNLNSTTINRKEKWEERQEYGYFKRQIDEISKENIWSWLRNGNLRRENQYFPIVAQKITIKSDYIEEK